MIGGGHAIQTALAEALTRHGMDLETAPVDTAVDSAVAAAPDLILLVGDAARDAGGRILERLSQSPLSRTVPVAILADDPSLGRHLEAFRHGAAAVIRRSASVDEIAERIAGLARQVPEPARIALEDVTLADLLGTLAERLRDVVLSTKAGTPDAQRVRLALSDGRGVARIFDDFTKQLQRHVVRAEPLEYELDHAEGRSALLDAEGTAHALSVADARGTRVVIADEDPARADAVAHELRRHGVTVLVTDLNPSPELFQSLRQLDPTIFIIGDEHEHAEGRGAELVRRVRSDTRSRWASRVVVHWSDVWPVATDGIARTLGMLAASVEPERSLGERFARSDTFDLRLETLGPARLLRALVELPHPARVTLYNPRARLQVDVSDSLIAGALGEAFDADGERSLEGYPALSALLAVSSGRVQVERVERPACLNVMSPVEMALELADAEQRPIAPSEVSVIEQPSSFPPPAARVPASSAQPIRDDAQVEEIVAAEPDRNLLARRVVFPLWALALMLVLLVVSAGWVVLSSSGAKRTETRTDLGLSPGPRRAEHEAKSGSLLDRARSGDKSALAEIERRQPNERSLAEALALAEGRAVQKLVAVEELDKRFAADPKRAPRPAEIRQLLDLARDPQSAPRAQAVIASLPGPIAPDLLYEVWIGTPARTSATELAEQLVYTEPVRTKASPALTVALDLRRVTRCEDVAEILPRLRNHGDQRAVRPVAGLNERLGCNPRTPKCLACLPKRAALVSATAAAKKRAAPAF
jgi:DNA-binding response OmpR family regulator